MSRSYRVTRLLRMKKKRGFVSGDIVEDIVDMTSFVRDARK